MGAGVGFGVAQPAMVVHLGVSAIPPIKVQAWQALVYIEERMDTGFVPAVLGRAV